MVEVMEKLNKEYCFEDFFDVDEIQNVQDSLANAFNLAMLLTTPEGLPITKPSHFSKFCEMIRETEEGSKRCILSDSVLGKPKAGCPRVQICLSSGLLCGGVNIFAKGEHIACWLIGQARKEAQSEEEMRKYAKEIGADEEEFIKAFYDVTVMSTEQFKKACNAIFVIGNQMTNLACRDIKIVELKETQDRLEKSEESLRITLNSIGDAVIATDIKANIVSMNPVAEKLTSVTEQEAIGKSLNEVFNIVNAESGDTVESPVEEILREGKTVWLEKHTVLISKNGEKHQIADSGAPIRDSKNNIVGIVLVFRDVTEQCYMENQLRQTQKMESIGQLAGGVAHDFNNMLSGIVGGAELLAMKIGENADLVKYVNVIFESAERASKLTRKLLDFAHKGSVLSVPVDVHDSIKNACQLLERSIDRRIEISTELLAENSIVIGDLLQLQNVFLNLGLNARDAMKKGGELKISTVNVELDSDFCKKRGNLIKSGQYIEIAVSDTGKGISYGTKNKIFEPFFTTKNIGEGVGLGLTAAYGSVKNHSGIINVYSERNIGSVFKVYLPLSDGKIIEKQDADNTVYQGTGLILVVDDEDIIRNTAESMLVNMGYDVILAEDGKRAVELYWKHHKEISLVLLDVVMPEMDGRDAFKAMKKINPDVKVILSSGFSFDKNISKLIDKGGASFIQKPYRLKELSLLIKEKLENK